jgi:putative ABC transport system permease protein
MQSLTFGARFFWWFSVRNLRNHFGRALTVLFGIALGAAVFTSVRLAVHASVESFTKSMRMVTGRAEYILFRPGGYVPETVLPQVLRARPVEHASALLTTYVRVPDREGPSFLLIGLDPILDRDFRSWQAVGAEKDRAAAWLEMINQPQTLLLGEPLAARYDLRPGDELNLEHAGRPRRFEMIGILAGGGLSLVEGGRVAVTDIATFQEFTGLYGKIDRVDITLRPGASIEALSSLLAPLPEGLELSPATARLESGQDMIRAYQLNLSILSFASLFVGMFLVYSLVALNAASRRRELAILRSTGASPRLLFATFLAEGGLFGICGWMLALPLGGVLVKFLLQGINQTISTLFARVYVDALRLSPWEIVFSLLATIGISLLAALQPAREAMKVSPKEAMEIPRSSATSPRLPARLALLGVCGIGGVVPLGMLPGVLGMPLPGYAAILLLFAGFALLAPWVLEKMGQGLSLPLKGIAGMPAYLAGRYVRDSGSRSAVSVGALITAVALFVSLVIMIHSFRGTVELWTRQTVSGDLFVTTKMNELNRFRFPIPADLSARLGQLAEEADLVRSRRFFLSYNGFPYEFEVMDMEPFMRHGDFVWMSGDADRIRELVKEGRGVLVSEVFSNRTGLEAGDLFAAQVEIARVRLPVLGVIRDYRTQGGVVFYSWKHFSRRYYPPAWSGVRFFLKGPRENREEALIRLRDRIESCCGERLDMISGAELRRSILKVFDETFAVTTVLLLIALVVAALGITTTLTVLVMERTRQLNTLLAIGADFRQIRSMIFWEAAFLVTAGESAGLACGFILSYLLVYVINRQSFGWTFVYGVDWAALGMSLPLIILTALAAALPAVRIVFREPPATLLRER